MAEGGDGDTGAPQKSFADLLRAWEDQHTVTEFDPTEIFHQMCDILEKETRVYVASDPDPFEVHLIMPT